jgi:general secretion pathway protein K
MSRQVRIERKKLVKRPSRARAEQGFILVAVLWILAMMAALLLIYTNFVVNTGVSVASTTQRVQTDAAIRAAIELAAFQLGSKTDSNRPTHGQFETRLDDGPLRIAFRSEGARVDLNSASKELLAGLMQSIGADPEDARNYADRILGWRTPAKSSPDQAENALYVASGRSYSPRHAPFPSVDELWLVLGIPAPVVERMIPFVTVYSNLTSVNIADAAPEVLRGLAGMTPEKMQALINARDDPTTDPKALNLQFGGEDKPPRTFRLDIRVEFDRIGRADAEVVILLLPEGDDPYRVLSWRSD